MPPSFISALINLSPHFFKRVDLISSKVIILVFYFGNQILCCPCHCLDILGRFLSILIGSDNDEQFRFVFIPSPFKGGMKDFSYKGNIMYTFFLSSL